MSDKISLPPKVAIEFTAQEIQAIVQGLNELPFKIAQPVIQHIIEACREPPAPAAV